MTAFDGSRSPGGRARPRARRSPPPSRPADGAPRRPATSSARPSGSSSPGRARRTTSPRPPRRSRGRSLGRPVIAVAALGADPPARRACSSAAGERRPRAGRHHLALRLDVGGRDGRRADARRRPSDDRRHLPRRTARWPRLADVTLVSPAGDEAAIVMTRSFASMLALLLAGRGRRRRTTATSRPTSAGSPGAGPRPSAAAAHRAAPGSDRLEPDRHPRRRAGVRDRRRVGAEADRDEPGPDERLRAARVPPRPDLRLRAGRAGRRAGRRRRARPTRSRSSRRRRGSGATTWLIARDDGARRAARPATVSLDRRRAAPVRRACRCSSTRPTPWRSASP